jgi:hypothetical protein
MSIWAKDVQAYTRMFYARYGNGPPGQTPWRLGRGLHSRFTKAPSVTTRDDADDDPSTSLTKAHLELQEKVPHTSLTLWQQYSSVPIEAVDLKVIKQWATAMRPRSIHDLKPMLILCQALLRDMSTVFEGEMDAAGKALKVEHAEQLSAAARQHATQTQVLSSAHVWPCHHRRSLSLTAVAT